MPIVNNKVTMENAFDSRFAFNGKMELPPFRHTRVMMMPLVLGDTGSVPASLSHWREPLQALCEMGGHAGEIGYLTIDEKFVAAGATHRRAGLHVDGVYQGRAGGWGGGGGGPWGSAGNGMLTVSSHAGCQAWHQRFYGWPGDEGECEHLREQCDKGEVFLPGDVYWLDGLCVHESLVFDRPVYRQFVRVSMPSAAPWFEGYTENPLGIKPTGEILQRRAFLDQ